MPRTPKRSTIPNSLAARFPVTLTAAELLASPAVAQDVDPPEPIDFTPVPRLRKRRGGWSEQAQRDFIACLQRTGSVAASARAVGLSPSSVYRLLDVPGAESFALAWDKAWEEGLQRIRERETGSTLPLRLYFFLAEPLLLELDLLELLLLFDAELFDPPDFDAALAMLRTPSSTAPYNRRVPTPVPASRSMNLCSPLVPLEQIGYGSFSTGGARPPLIGA